ncbi:MBG domain-containing protein [Janthinobacterium fluminis]|uniref:MBG domain-containing protein n=1 Tax=Janthinobacterium fluminis TaxID=2987524 RepID=A0ABT5JUA7_9BURK|nr:MBG domain-containing protein [Janthinobacterium fluminis]MDC8756303.1 MBG domain-containing protein [Janthinobacterium fluminis]
MHRPSLNHVYRLIWSHHAGAFVAVAENAKKGGKKPRSRGGVAAVLSLLLGTGAGAADLPTGGQIVAGAGSISQAARSTTITQLSPKMAADWQSFSIGQGNTVTFVQPSRDAVALNRVLGADVSNIQGALQSNGQVFLINPNGVLFSPSAQVNVGALVASTLNLSTDDFMAGNYKFQGASDKAVVNRGSITAQHGGSIALIAARIENTGTLLADGGNVALGAGSAVTLDLGGPVKVQVTAAAIDALIANGGAIRADGGTILLSAKAAGDLASTAINNTGLIQARTLASGAKGEIRLLGDMTNDRIEVGGKLDASAPHGGNGGFIETSAATVNTAPELLVDAGAKTGKGGEWLIDPYDYVISGSTPGTSAYLIASTLSGGTSVTVTTQSNSASYGATGSGAGDITVNSAITKSGGGAATLTLRADNNIIVNSDITSSSGALNITLSAGNAAGATTGGVDINANLGSNGGRILIGGAAGTASNGIGYALNRSAALPAVTIEQSKSILSGGGDITINGKSSATSSNYSGTGAGVYVKSGAAINSGGGNINMSGISTTAAKEFGFAVEGNSGTVTTFTTSGTTGHLIVDAVNQVNVDGALGLVNNGGQARIQFIAPSVADMLFKLNGNPQLTSFTIKPPCGSSYPNCGTLVVPGSNGSYLYANYQAVNMATQGIYVFTPDGSKVYDGASLISGGLTLSSLGGPSGTDNAATTTYLGGAPLTFSTGSKNVGTYSSTQICKGATCNPTNYSTNYAIGYYHGSYSITPLALTNVQATNKVYDGTNAAAITASGILAGDNVVLSATGAGFASSNVGNNIAVNASGVSLSGSDAGNYTVPGGAISTSANITPASLTVTANGASKVYGQTPSLTGFSASGLQNGETVGSVTLASAGSAAGASVNGGPYAITASGATGGTFSPSNYTIAYVNGALTITPATLSYSANTASRAYGSANPAFGGSVSGFVNGDNLASATSGTLAFGSAATATSDVGSYAVNGSGLSANNGNYTFVQAGGNAGALTINPAALTVTANDASKVYGQTPSLTGFSASGLQNGETVGSVTLASAGGTAGASVSGGPYAITASGAAGGTFKASNYTVSYVNGALTITPATLSYSANGVSRAYGSVNPAFGGSVSGFVNGDNLASATSGTLAFGSAATATSDVGSYAVIGSGLSANNGNYTFVQAGGNAGALTINPAALTVTANNVSKVYGQTPSLTGFSASGLQNGETVGSVTLASAGGTAGASVSGGPYAITASGASGGTFKASNYTVSYVNGALTITPATLSYGANGASRAYGSANPAFGGSVSGFVNGDNLASATSGTLAFGSAATATSDVGSYAVNGSGLSANNGNYTFVQAGGNAGALTINPAALTVTANDASKVYGQTPSLTGFSASGLQNGETVGSVTLASAGGAAGASVNGGPYAITASGVAGGTFKPSNYEVSYVNGALTITPAALTVTANNASKVYGQTPSLTGFSASGLQNGETVGSVTLASAGGAAGANVNGGPYAITASGASGGTFNVSNYAVNYVNGALTVTPATLSYSANGASRAYGSANPAFGGSVSGFVNDDNLASATSGALAFGSAATAASDVGSYAVNGSGLSANNGNYTFVQAGGNAGALTINPAALTVTANNASKVYGQTPSLTGFSASGLQNGETVGSVTLASAGGAAGASVNGGPYAITASGVAGGTFKPSNYEVSYVNGALTINPAALTVTANNASKVYGQTPSLTGFSASGLQNGETVGSVTLASAGGAAGANVNGGPYAITASGASGGTFNVSNYAVSYVNGALTVTPATLSYSANGASRAYGSANPAFGGSVSGFVNDDNLASATSGTLAFGSAATATSDVGSYAVNGSGLSANNGNYTFVQAGGNAGALTINPATLTVTANDASKVYGQTPSLTGFSASGLQNGETVGSVTLASAGGAAGASVNGGPYAITASEAAGGTFKASNYAVSYVNGALTITPATLSYIANAANRSTGIANPVFSGSVSGFVNDETLASATSGTLAFSSPADGTSGAGRYAINGAGLNANNGNYQFVQADANLAALTITQAAVTPVPPPVVIVPTPSTPDPVVVVTPTPVIPTPNPVVVVPTPVIPAPTPVTGVADPVVLAVAADAQQFVPRTFPVQQFLNNGSNLPLSNPTVVSPDSLSYVMLNSGSGSPAVAAEAPASNAGTTTVAGAGADLVVNGVPVAPAGPTNVFVVDGGINMAGFVVSK